MMSFLNGSYETVAKEDGGKKGNGKKSGKKISSGQTENPEKQLDADKGSSGQTQPPAFPHKATHVYQRNWCTY